VRLVLFHIAAKGKAGLTYKMQINVLISAIQNKDHTFKTKIQAYI